MVEQGKEYNPETAADLRARSFQFQALGETFQFTLQIPEYINRRLSSAILDRLHEYMDGYAVRVVTDALRGGYAFTDAGRGRMATDVGLHLKNYIWERFSITQEAAGFDCWQVAPSLQVVRA